MPYYKEWFVNTVNTSRVNTGAPKVVILDHALVTSFRTRPHPRAVARQELLAINVDPYAYFLDSISRRRYHDALSKRGLSPHGAADNGHPFEMIRHTVKSQLLDFRLASTNYFNGFGGYAGNELNSIHDGNHSVIPNFGSDGLGTFAQQAYNRVAPTAVVFDAANFLGELREGLPRLALQTLKGSSGFFRGLGADYLNVEFGWKPFIRDLQNAGRALFDATNQLSGKGERVHRRYSVPATETMGVSGAVSSLAWDVRAGNTPYPSGWFSSSFPLPSQIAGVSAPYTTFVTAHNYANKSAWKRRRQERWFEGEFTSFFPLRFDPSNYFDRFNALVNLSITPETLWNLAPWSWLVDWNLRIGESISANIAAGNNLLVMHYGYAMEKTVFETGSFASLPANSPPGTVMPSKMANYTKTTRMRRIRANPYGFTSGGAAALSVSQIAILAALGLTKI